MLHYVFCPRLACTVQEVVSLPLVQLLDCERLNRWGFSYNY
jgi:hypothetical protein